MPEFQNWWVVIKWTFQKVLFITVFFPSYYWNKFACLNPSYLCYFPVLYLVRYWFFILNNDSNKFPYIYSQINADNSLLLSNYLIKMSISFFPSQFFHFICYIFILQLIFLENTYYYKSKRIFFHEHWEAIYFFHGEKGRKSNHNNLLFNYWPCS